MKKYCLLFCAVTVQNLLLSSVPEKFVDKTRCEYSLSWEDPSKTSFEIRTRLLEIFVSAFLQAFRSCGSFADKSDAQINANMTNYFKKFIDPRFSDNSSLFAVVRTQTNIIGAAFFEKTIGSEICLVELAIDPPYWRRGIGRYVMNAILRKEPDTKKIWLITGRRNKGAQAFYESLGFKPSNKTREGYSPDLYCGYEMSFQKS